MVTQNSIVLIDKDKALFEALEQGAVWLGPVAIKHYSSENNALPENPVDSILIYGLEDPPCETLGSFGTKILISDNTLIEQDNEGFFDMVLVRPLRLGQLLTILRDSLRRKDSPAEPLYAGGCVLDIRKKTLHNKESGKFITLTEKETRLLQMLFQSAPRTINREELLEKVWRHSQVLTTHTLETHIYRLRQKIETGLGLSDLILTKPGGYCLGKA